MRVQDIMTRRVQTVAHTENAEAAWNLMRWKRIHHLVVTGEGRLDLSTFAGKVVGGVLEWELTGGTVFRAGKDDIVWVPRGTVHHIRNVGDALSLRLAVAMPPAMHYASPCEQCGYTDDGPREWCA